MGVRRKRVAERDAGAGASEVMRRVSAVVAGIVIACCVIAIPGFDRRGVRGAL